MHELTLPAAVAALPELKRQHPGLLVLFRIGDYYEALGADAETASRVWGITLASVEVDGARVPLCGVPFYRVEHYAAMLLRAPHRVRVALCDAKNSPPVAIVRRNEGATQ